jgi:hypothetical protein
MQRALGDPPQTINVRFSLKQGVLAHGRLPTPNASLVTTLSLFPL